MPKHATFIVLGPKQVRDLFAPDGSTFVPLLGSCGKGEKPSLVGCQIIKVVESGFEVEEYERKEMDTVILEKYKPKKTDGGVQVWYEGCDADEIRVFIRFGSALKVDCIRQFNTNIELMETEHDSIIMRSVADGFVYQDGARDGV